LVNLALTTDVTLSRRSGSPERFWLRKYRSLLRWSDVGVVGATLALSLVLGRGSLAPFEDRLAVLGALGVTWLWFLTADRSRDVRVLGTGPTEYRRVIQATSLAFGALAIVLVAIGTQMPRVYFLIALPVGLGTLTLERWLWRRWLSHQRRLGHFLSRALIVGTPADASYVTRQIERTGASYRVVGVIDISAIATVASLARERSADVVIVASRPAGENDAIRELAWSLENGTTELVLASRLTDVAGPRIHFRPVDGLPLMHVELPQFQGGKHHLKRVFDLVCTTSGAILVAPLIAALAVLISVDTSGSPFFRQTRVGRDGNTFTMWKLRTMYSASEQLPVDLDHNDGSGPLFKLRDDPRVTRVGRLLRKYSLDELPQLLNVLAGDMSLVGPRPPLPREVAQYSGSTERRLYIKPGLTGMWQINGRSDLSWDESIRLDLYYVENWSLTGDLVILWRTVKVICQPVGAY
jgi:exopolysaccharide biosynthesis polyprenyl glycosylphosphotransferase